MKQKNIPYFFIILFHFALNTTSAQKPDSINFVVQDSFDIANPDSFTTIDTILSADTLLTLEKLIDENLNDIFSEKMDSLVKNWDIRHKFHFDTTDISLLGTFPKDLPDSVYIQRLKETEFVVDLSYNNVVRNFIKMYTEKRREQVEVMLGLSAYYFPIFEEILDKYNMPLEIKYLVIIESALNPIARSRVGATGLWQFMYGTAKQYNLEISTFVDERNDPVKSTDAAARFLQNLFETYGDWHLAIAAYNCGPGNVNRAIRRAGGKTNYWEIYYGLPRETRGYVPAFIAATYTMEYYKEHNLIPRFPDISLYTDTIVVNDFLHFDQIVSTVGIEKEQLRALNPMYRRDVIPAKMNKPYPLVLPEDKIFAFIDLDTTVFAYEREKYFPDNTLISPTQNTGGYFTPADVKGKAKVIYTVKSGDNVGFISSWFKVRSSDLRYWNNINRDLIRTGQKLAIYVNEKDKGKYDKVNAMSFAEKQSMIGKPATPAKKPDPVPVDPNFVYYTVRSGDSIWDIAQKYVGISSDEILRLNNIANEKGLYVGQKLKIKKKT